MWCLNQSEANLKAVPCEPKYAQLWFEGVFLTYQGKQHLSPLNTGITAGFLSRHAFQVLTPRFRILTVYRQPLFFSKLI